MLRSFFVVLFLAVVSCSFCTGCGGDSQSSSGAGATLAVATISVVRGRVFEAEEEGAGCFVISTTDPIRDDLDIHLEAFGTAVPGIDYIPLPESVTIPAGETSVLLSVFPIDDLDIEPDKTIEVRLVDGPGIKTELISATVTLVSDDLPTVNFADVDSSVFESSGMVRIGLVLDAPAPKDLRITCFSAGTAAAGVDYVDSSLEVSIAEGEREAQLDILLIDNRILDGIRTLVLTLEASAHYMVGSLDESKVQIVSDDAPLISIASDMTTISEVDGKAFLTISLSETFPSKTIVVQFEVAGSATMGDDFEALSGSVTFPPGVTEARVMLSTIDDIVVESPESVVISLLPSSELELGLQNEVVVVIVSDEIPTVSIVAADDQAAETGDTGDFVFSLDTVLMDDLDVFFTVGGSADFGSDYVSFSDTVTILKGETTASIGLLPILDYEVEGDETVLIRLFAGNYDIDLLNRLATVTILDYELPTVSCVATDTEASEDGDTATIEIQLSKVCPVDVGVELEVGGTTDSTDYRNIRTSITIPAGQLKREITIHPKPDALAEPSETLVISVLESVKGAYHVGYPDSAVIDIENSDNRLATLTVTDSSASETGDTGAFSVWLSGPATEAVTVYYDLRSSTAVNGFDYVTLPGAVTIPVGQNSAVISVVPINDTKYEGPETISMELFPAHGYFIGEEREATVYLSSDEALPVVSVSAIDASTMENGGPATVRFSSTIPSSYDLPMEFGLEGTASAGADYHRMPRHVVIPAGQTNVDLQIFPVDDDEPEGVETVRVSLHDGIDYSASLREGEKVAEVTIISDETAPTVSIEAIDSFISEDDESGWIVSVDSPVADDLVVSILPGYSTATEGKDYHALPRSVTIPAGLRQAIVPLVPVLDDLEEGEEWVELRLVAGYGYTKGAQESPSRIIFGNEKSVQVSLSCSATDLLESGPRQDIFVLLDRAVSVPLTVYYETSGSVDVGEDCQSLPGRLIIPAGERMGRIPIIPIDDDIPEGKETLSVYITPSGDYDRDESYLNFNFHCDDGNLPIATLRATDSNAAQSGDPGEFTVTLDRSSNDDLTIEYYVSGGSAAATPGIDYLALPGILIIPAGQISGTIPVVPLVDGGIEENDEHVMLWLQRGTGYLVTEDQLWTEVWIDNLLQSIPPVASIDTLTREVNEWDEYGTFRIYLNRTSEDDVHVEFQLSGSARIGRDFMPIENSVVIPAGQTSVELRIDLIDDTLAEGSEWLQVRLTDDLGYEVAGSSTGSPSATMYILDDELLPAISAVVTNRIASEDGDVGRVQFRLDEPATADVVVRYGVSGSAIPGLDYEALPGETTIRPGERSVSIDIIPIDDTFLELEEDVELTLLSDVSYRVLTSAASVKIESDEQLPTVSLVNTGGRIAEGETGEITISLSHSMPTDTIVFLDDYDYSAERYEDYVPIPTNIIIPSGETEVGLPVTAIADELPETTEYFYVSLDPGAYAQSTTSSRCYVYIEGAASSSQVKKIRVIATDKVAEEGDGNAFFTVVLDEIAEEDIEVKFELTGTAVSTVDYHEAPTSVTILAGQSSAMIEIIPIDDEEEEYSETVVLTLLNDDSYSIENGLRTATVTISSDEKLQSTTLPSLRISPVSAASEDGDVGSFLFFLDRPATEDLIINYRSYGSSAQWGTDIDDLPGILVIEEGEDSASLSIHAIDDDIVEHDEIVGIYLNNGEYQSNYLYDDAKLVLKDNDLGPTVSVWVVDALASDTGDSAQFRIQLDVPAEEELVVEYEMSGTARNGTDYELLDEEITIPQGQDFVLVEVIGMDGGTTSSSSKIIELELVKRDYYKLARQSSFTQAQAYLEISNPIPIAKVIASDAHASENSDEGEFLILLNEPAADDLTINYSYLTPSSRWGTDVEEIPLSVAISAGERSAAIPVIPIDDNLYEAEFETVGIELERGTGYVITSDWEYDSAWIYVRSDEALPVAHIRASDKYASEDGDQGEFTIFLNKPAHRDIVVNYSDQYSDVTFGEDIEPLSWRVTIREGETSATIPVIPRDDQILERTEDVDIELEDGDGYVVTRDYSFDEATVLLISDEVGPTASLTASDTRATEGSDTAEFTVHLDISAPEELTINYSVDTYYSDVTSGDYESLSGTVTVHEGERTATIILTAINDDFVEDLEELMLKLSSGEGYLLAEEYDDRKASIYIISDDLPE